MPIFDVQKWLGIDIDRWILLQCSEQPYNRASLCHVFEKDYVECSHGIGRTRAKKECKLEFEDLLECMRREKTLQRMREIRKQRNKLIKENSYTSPPHHTGHDEARP